MLYKVRSSGRGCRVMLLLWLLVMLPLTQAVAQLHTVEGNQPGKPIATKLNDRDSAEYGSLLNRSKNLLDTQPDSAIALLRQAQTVCRRARYDYGELACALAISSVYHQQGAFTKAMQILQREQDRIESGNYSNLKLELTIRKGLYYESTGRRDTAIRYYLQALEFIQKHPESDKKGQYYASTCLTLGNLYLPNRADISIAIYYLEKVRAFALKKGDKEWLANALLALGSAYADADIPYMRPDSTDVGVIDKQKTGYRKGLAYFKQVLALNLVDSFPDLAKDVYKSISIIYANLEITDSAIMYARKALEIRKTDSFWNRVADIKILTTLGAAYINGHAYNEATKYLETALTRSRGDNNHYQLMEINKLLYMVYSRTGQPIKALQSLEAYTFMRDSLVDAEKGNAISELEVKYRTSEKDKLLAEKSLSISRQQSHIKEKNLWIVISTLSVLLLAIFLVFLRRNHLHWRKRQQEQLLHWQQGEDIRNLKALIYGEEKERARIGQELHDGIIGQLAAAKINFTILRDKYPFLKPDFSEAISYLDDTAQELRKTAHNLMPGILIEQGLMAAINTYCEKISTFTGIQINVHQEGAVPSLDKDFELSIYRMVQELVQNIIKHANAAKALVQLDCHDSLLILTVEDNGCGMMESQVTDGTGLANMKTRVKALRGHMDITGSPGQGTSVYIELDISLIKSDRELCL